MELGNEPIDLDPRALCIDCRVVAGALATKHTLQQRCLPLCGVFLRKGTC